MQYSILPLTSTDLPQAHAMTQALGWPHRQQDWQHILDLGDAIALKDDSKLIGTGAVLPQGDYASIGLVVIDQKYQQQGLGRTIVEQLINHSPLVDWYLTATLAGEPLYRKLGFRHYQRVHQYQAKVKPLTPVPENRPSQHTIDDYRPNDSASLQQLMQSATQMNRDKIVDWLCQTSQRIIVLKHLQQITGYACLREFGRGLCIGPVIAQTEDQACYLIRELLAGVSGQFVRIDIPSQYRMIAATLTTFGLTQVDDVSQMVKGATPTINPDCTQFALVTQAIG
ncbi:GNAT family N-acetyltransferase [Vibrio sp. AK197]